MATIGRTYVDTNRIGKLRKLDIALGWPASAGSTRGAAQCAYTSRTRMYVLIYTYTRGRGWHCIRPLTLLRGSSQIDNTSVDPAKKVRSREPGTAWKKIDWGRSHFSLYCKSAMDESLLRAKSDYGRLPLESPTDDKFPEKGGEDYPVTVHSSRKTPRRNFMIFFLLAFLVIAISLVITFAILYGVGRIESSSTTSSPSSPTQPPSDICQTEACFDLSVQILASMDDTVDPCEDFYNFTCRNWDIYQHIRPGLYCFLCTELKGLAIVQLFTD